MKNATGAGRQNSAAVRLLSSRRGLITLACLFTAFLLFLLWAWVPPHISAEKCPLTENAAWISVDWTSLPIQDADVQHLAVDMNRRKIRYLFPFTTYLREDGAWSPSFDHAAQFVSAFRQHDAYETQIVAWVGIPVRSERRFTMWGYVDLSDEQQRRQIVDFAVRLTTEIGFDGVHLDVEHVDNNDVQFLLLLQEVRDALDSQALLSVAGNDWVPGVVNVLPLIHDYKWGSRYVGQVAKHVDQIAFMTYDSMLPHPALYRLWMREQVKGLDRAMRGSDAQLLIGLSVSREEINTHHPRVENMSSGLAGTCAGAVSLSPSHYQVEGVAIYAAWEATPGDWQIWETWTSGF